MKVLTKSAGERAEMAIRSLEKIYPDVDLRSRIIGEPITVSWEPTRCSLGRSRAHCQAYRYNRRMHSHFLQDEFAPGHRGIFLAGDDVSWTPGWAEGAVHTKLNAVWGIMAHFGGASLDGNPAWGTCTETSAPSYSG